MTTAPPPASPGPGSLADTRYAELVERCRAAGVRVHDDAGVAERLRKLLLASDFAYETLRRDPVLLGASGLERLRDPAPASARAAALARGGEDFSVRLRRFRQAEALRLVFRDINGLDDLSDTLGGTTALYETLIAAALRDAEARMRARYGTPRNAQGEAQALVVMALGKLGGGELNFSSDVDLILAFPEAGETDGPRALDNAEFFARVAREFVRSLSESSENGIAARVDLRLRPFGEVGPVVVSFAAMEQYYQREGRDWERYAWIKARPVAGDLAAGRRLLDLLRPFVYRRYFDYTALAGLREMKGLIDAEVARRDLAEHLKLGPGGIREIEFIVQLQQLIRGGRDPALRVQGLLPALEACARRGYLSALHAKALREAYVFLRRLENRVQMFADQQTHAIPDEPLIRARLAATLGFDGWEALQAQLDIHRGKVAEAFAAVLLPQARGAATAASVQSVSAWREAHGGSQGVMNLVQAGFEPADEAAAALAQVANLRGLSARAMQRLEHLVPLLIEAARATSAPTPALVNLCRLVQAIARRSAYLALLEEHPAARTRVARLCAEQAWLAQRVIAQPLLLDDVLDPRLEHLPQGEAEIERELAGLLAAHAGDPEETLGAIAEWRDSFALRAGLALRDGHADGVLTARRLALAASVVVGAVLQLARRELIAQHGALPGEEHDDQPGFAVLGYGSLGGAELGFASDLDLVFIYDPARGAQVSGGARPLEGARWYARLAQRVVHWLSTPTRAGRLYEIDTRLRPDGSKGLLVASLPAFVAYQRERAWTWEHQALVRARTIAGDAGLRAAFERERAALLALPREPARIVADVLKMRAQWRTERDRSDASRFDLKQGAGGLLDIEFLLQGLVLRHAGQHAGLTAATDTPGLIAACAAAGALPERDAQELLDAHAALLSRALHCTLEARPRVMERDAGLVRINAEVLRIAREAGFDLSAT
jgi:glutamate-ammonia-ligase adenylyltransferase